MLTLTPFPSKLELNVMTFEKPLLKGAIWVKRSERKNLSRKLSLLTCLTFLSWNGISTNSHYGSKAMLEVHRRCRTKTPLCTRVNEVPSTLLCRKRRKPRAVQKNAVYRKNRARLVSIATRPPATLLLLDELSLTWYSNRLACR